VIAGRSEWWTSKWWKDQWRTQGSNEAPIEPETDAPQRVPFVRCPVCGGEGVALSSPPTGHHPPTECVMCSGRGVVRAQLVVSLVDLPSGRVASKSIVPGVLPPQAAPNGQPALDLATVVRELAAQLDVSSIHRVSSREMVAWDPEAPWLIPLRYPAEASHAWRYEYEAAAIAQAARHTPHLILFAGVDAEPGPSADESLGRLVALADDLQLDLVIDVRVERAEALTWSVRLDFPGAGVTMQPNGRFNTLHRALRETSVETAMAWLRSGAASGPARWLDVSPARALDAVSAQAVQAQEITWAELSATLTPLAVERQCGAVAVRRQGEWYSSALESAVDPENDRKQQLRAVPELPAPIGALIPSSICSKCHGDTTSHCYGCSGGGRVLDGLAVTITDLEHRTRHVNWSPLEGGEDGRAGKKPDGREPISGTPLRANEILLDADYSVGELARSFEVRPHLLRDHHRGAALDLSLIDGRVPTANGASVAAYLHDAGRRRAAGRLIVLARPEPEVPVQNLFRSVVGLGLALVVRVRTARPERTAQAPSVLSWRIQVLPGSEPDLTRSEAGFSAAAPSLAAAVANLQTGLDPTLRRALTVDKLEPLLVPQQADPVTGGFGEIEVVFEALGDLFPETDIWLGVNHSAWTIRVGRPHDRSATATSIYPALAVLVAPSVVEPQPNELRRILELLLGPSDLSLDDATDESGARDAGDEECPSNAADVLEAEIQDWPGRIRFGVALVALAQCLVDERFGSDPKPVELQRCAEQAHREALADPDPDDGPVPGPEVFVEVLTLITEPTRRTSNGLHSVGQLSVLMDILRSLIRDRRKTDADFTGIIDQAVEAGILMARAVARTVTESVERREQ
jgi:hypothetical protein